MVRAFCPLSIIGQRKVMVDYNDVLTLVAIILILTVLNDESEDNDDVDNGNAEVVDNENSNNDDV